MTTDERRDLLDRLPSFVEALNAAGPHGVTMGQAEDLERDYGMDALFGGEQYQVLYGVRSREERLRFITIEHEHGYWPVAIIWRCDDPTGSSYSLFLGEPLVMPASGETE